MNPSVTSLCTACAGFFNQEFSFGGSFICLTKKGRGGAHFELPCNNSSLLFVHPKAQSCLIERVNNIQEKSDLSSVWLKGVLVVLSIFHIGQNLSVSTINMKWMCSLIKFLFYSSFQKTPTLPNFSFILSYHLDVTIGSQRTSRECPWESPWCFQGVS